MGPLSDRQATEGIHVESIRRESLSSLTLSRFKMCRTKLRSGGIIGFFVMLSLAPCLAQSSAAESWVRIEEDWELVVGEPDTSINSPQLTVYYTPSAQSPEIYFQVQLNHAADESFLGGGFRVAAVQSDERVDEALSGTRAMISYTGDTIRWTNVMAVVGDEILFAIKNGTSQSWGEFGGPEYLLRMQRHHVSDFSDYSPEQSVSDIDFGYGRNRVQSLVLKRVRAYRADGTYAIYEANLSAQ